MIKNSFSSVKLWIAGILTVFLLGAIMVYQFENSSSSYKLATIEFWGASYKEPSIDSLVAKTDQGNAIKNYIYRKVSADGGTLSGAIFLNDSCDSRDMMLDMVPIRATDDKFTDFEVLCGWGKETYIRPALLDKEFQDVIANAYIRETMTEFNEGDPIPSKEDYVLIARFGEVEIEQGYAREFDWYEEDNRIVAYRKFDN